MSVNNVSKYFFINRLGIADIYPFTNLVIQKIIITYPDRLLRFGFSLIEKLCQHFGTEITLLNLKKEQSFEETLAQDLITIITVFSSKLYGKRSHHNKNKQAIII